MNWWEYPITGPYDPTGSGERGVDLSMPVGTPIYSAYAGTVLPRSDYANATDFSKIWQASPSVPGVYAQTGYNLWGGEVDLLTSLSGLGQFVNYTLHLDQLVVRPGQHVDIGQLIGYSGGENSLSTTNVVPGYSPTHIASPQFSSGPHIEWGFYKGAWQSNIDPTPYLTTLRNGGLPGTSNAPPVGVTLGSGPLGIPGVNDLKAGFTGSVQRASLVAFGGLLVLVGILVLFFASPSGQALEQAGMKAAMTA